MTGKTKKILRVAGGLLLACASIAATILVVKLRWRRDNPLAPPPVVRTIALREVVSLNPPASEEAAPTATPLAAPTDEFLDSAPDPELGRPMESLAPEPAAVADEAAADELGLPALSGLPVPHPGKDGPQRLEDARPVTERGGYARPKWSPLGIDIAMVRVATREVFIQAPAPGSAPRFVFRLPALDTPFSWNSDGVTFRAQFDGMGGWAEVLLTGETYSAAAPVSPVVSVSGRIIALPPFPGGQPLLLSAPGDEYQSPLLSPDGTWVAYSGLESGLYLSSLRTGLIWRVGPGLDPVWLPDSSGIVFSRKVHDLDGPVGGDLVMASVDGRYMTNLTRSPGLFENHPTMAPDGERVGFTRDGAVFVGVYRENKPDSGAADPGLSESETLPSGEVTPADRFQEPE